MLYVKVAYHSKSLASVTIKPAIFTEKTSGWCNRHQKQYNYSDCETHQGFYLCPDCLIENWDKPLTVGKTHKEYEWRESK